MKLELAKLDEQLSRVPSLSHRLDKHGHERSRCWPGGALSLSPPPRWCHALRGVFAHTPSAVPTERAFSILNNSFGDDQARALADYMELLKPAAAV